MLTLTALITSEMQAQTWTWAADVEDLESHALDCIEGMDGRIHVAIAAKSAAIGTQFSKGQVVNLEATGTLSTSADIAYADAGVVPYGFMLDSTTGTLTVFSNVTDSLLWMGPEGATIGISSFTPELVPIDMHEVPTGFSQGGQIVLPLSDDEAAVAITGWPQDQPFSGTIRVMRVDLQGNLLDNDFVAQCTYCGATSLTRRTDGTLLMGTRFTGLSNTYSGGDLVYLDAVGEILGTYGTPSVDDTLETYHTIMSALVVRPLPNERLVLAGATRPDAEERYQSVLQVTDSTMSEVYAQFFPAHEHMMDHPGVARCLDLSIDGSLLFAQTENVGFGITLPELGWPSAVRLYRFDSDLNVTGSYLIDGIADSSYYFLRSVRATADGGALLSGSVADVHMNATDTRTKAWVAKVSMEDLTMPVAERSATIGWLVPNPGTDGFRLELSRPLHGGSFRIIDATGRLVQFKRLEGIRADCDTRSWVAGLYHVVVCDMSGTPVFGTTWIKQ